MFAHRLVGGSLRDTQVAAAHPARVGDQRAIAHHVDPGVGAAKPAPGRDLEARGDTGARLEGPQRLDVAERARGADRLDLVAQCFDCRVELGEALAPDPRPVTDCERVAQAAGGPWA